MFQMTGLYEKVREMQQLHTFLPPINKKTNLRMNWTALQLSLAVAKLV